MNKFLEISDIISLSKEREINKNALEIFFSDKKDVHRFVIGKNEQSKFIIENYKIDGIIDDFSVPNEKWCGREIVKSTIPSNSIVVNCATSISPISAEKCIREDENISIISYSELFYSKPKEIEIPGFVKDARNDISINYNKYKLIFSIFKDDLSRKIFNDLIKYRITADSFHMNSYSKRLSDQYFEPFIGDQENSVFVDCGGFDGDTTEEFCKRYPKYKKIFLFEPSKKNIENARVRLKNTRDIYFVELGISEEEGSLNFDPESGSASSVSNTGSSFIEVTTLDKFIKEPVSFIKMDLEGWELPALKGSINRIQKDSPILAISVYHSISDFWEIPEFILSKNNKYDIYLRHYTEGWSETVMYFLPN